MAAPLHDDEETSEGSPESCRHVGDQKLDHEVNARDERGMNNLSNANQQSQPRPNLPDLNAAASEEDMGFDYMAVIPYYGGPVNPCLETQIHDEVAGVPRSTSGMSQRVLEYGVIDIL